MEKDTSGLLKRADHFQIILLGEGILVGGVAGFTVIFYRMMLEFASEILNHVITYAKGRPLRMALWFACLALLAWVVSRLVEFEPMISGSGIPQVEGEMIGKLDQNWVKVLAAKFSGGFLCLLGGLALGREGPSIQLGAMVGKGISRGMDRGKTEERFLLTCGASAGLSAAFHAPLAGVMFSLEEIHKNFSVSVLLSVMASSLTADFLSSSVFGMDPVFSFDIIRELPHEYYWMLLILGVILGVLGAFYNWFTLKVQSLYNHAGRLSSFAKLLIPFFCAGVLAFTSPELLGSGHALIEQLTNMDMLIGTVLFVLVSRFIYSAVSFGSGAPGGIFFPLLVLGGFIGGAFALFCTQYFGLDAVYVNNFVLLAMAGYFSAIVRAPLTGIILIYEMTGSLSQMLSLSLVSIVAYVAATLLKSKPIYESLLERVLQKQKKSSANGAGASDDRAEEVRGQKVLSNYVVYANSRLDEALIRDIEWPRHCLLVAVQRGVQELIPMGKTRLQVGDVIVTMTDERDEAYVREKMEALCSSF